MNRKVILIILDGLGWQCSRSLLGNIEGWVDRKKAQVWKMKSVLPSTSGPCYVSIHTGLQPQTHGIYSNRQQERVGYADIFSEVRTAGLRTAAVAHSYFSVCFQDAPFEPLRDIEVNDENRAIQYARFYTMAGETAGNLAVPSDFDLFTQATVLAQRYKPDYILVHNSSPDSVGHAYGAASIQMDTNAYEIDVALSHFLPVWLNDGFEVMITADHGQSARGHHGGTTDDMRDVAFYYFGDSDNPTPDKTLCQTQVAPTVLKTLGVEIPDAMLGDPFLF